MQGRHSECRVLEDGDIVGKAHKWRDAAYLRLQIIFLQADLNTIEQRIAVKDQHIEDSGQEERHARQWEAPDTSAPGHADRRTPRFIFYECMSLCRQGRSPCAR